MVGILIWLLAVPLAGAVIGACLQGERTPRRWALAVSLATAAITVLIATQFDFARSGEIQLLVSPSMLQLREAGVSVTLGIDSISFWLIALTSFLTPLAIAASWESIATRRKEYYAWMLLLQFAMLGVFVARDLLLFYVFFELTLVPMFFIIGIWGGAERQYAALKFFLFTFAASVLTLAGVVYLGTQAGAGLVPSFRIEDVLAAAQSRISPTARFWVFAAMLVGFAAKVPLFPVHTWLPLAHTEAPTAGSVILAGVLLKLGSYGLLRFALPIGAPDVLLQMTPLIGAMCLIGIIYGALVAWVQQDIKKLVAYSSVSHMGFCVLGLLAMNQPGVQGSILYMLNHGLSTGAMFLVVGMIYERYHTRDINQLSGLARKMPRLAFFFVLFTFSSIGLPGLNGFVSEFLTILGAFTSPRLGVFYGVVASCGIVLGAVYMLHMVACVIFGPLKVPNVAHGEHATEVPADIGRREVALLMPLAVVVVILGVVPQVVLRTLEDPVSKVIADRGSLPRMVTIDGPAAVDRIAGLGE